MTLTLRKISEEEILRAADALQPEIRRTFLTAIEALRKSLPLSKIEDLLAERKLADALNEIGKVSLTEENLAPIRDAIRRTAQTTGEITAAEFGMSFDLVNPRAVRFAQESAARLVSGVDSETMQAIRDVIVRGQVEGLNVRAQRNLIETLVGLTRRDAAAVDRFFAGQLQAGILESRAQAQADRMARRLLRQRAETIARTETIRASNMGTQLAWETALDEGLLPQGVQKVWIATEDPRTCPICIVLDGQVVAVEGEFTSTEQAASFSLEGGKFQVASTKPLKVPVVERTPPAHARCRCTTGIAADTGDQERAITRTGTDLDLSALNQLDDASRLQALSAIEDMQERFPVLSGEWGDNHPLSHFRGKPRGLDRISTTSSPLGVDAARVTGIGGARSKMDISQAVARAAEAKSTVGGSVYDVIVHEMGHVVHNAAGNAQHIIGREGTLDELISQAKRKTFRGKTISSYGRTNNEEFFAEMFAARNGRNIQLPSDLANAVEQFAEELNVLTRDVYGVDIL